MKTRTWLLIFASVALVCTAALLIPHKAAKTAEVRSDGKVLCTLDLSKDGEYRVEHGEDWNLLIVENGKIRVDSASCTSQDCVRRGAADGGAPIVCLPNRLVIEFSDDGALDALLG